MSATPQTPIRWEPSREGLGWVSTNTADALRVEQRNGSWWVVRNEDLAFGPVPSFAAAEKFCNERFPVFSAPAEAAREEACDGGGAEKGESGKPIEGCPPTRHQTFRGNYLTAAAQLAEWSLWTLEHVVALLGAGIVAGVSMTCALAEVTRRKLHSWRKRKHTEARQ